MTTRSMGASAGFGWLKRGISVGFRHPKPVFGGAALLGLAMLIPICVMLPVQFHLLRAGAQPTAGAFGWIMAVPMLLGLLLVPLYAGYLQLIEAAENGQDAHATDIVKPYREGHALRVIGFSLLFLVLYVALVAIAIMSTGGGFASWYMQLLTAQANHQLPPALPAGFGITFLLLAVIALLLGGIQAIGLGQVALGRRNAVGAMGDGIIGALKNTLPIFVLAIISVLVFIGLGVAVGIIGLVLALIGKLVGAWFILVLFVPLYIAMLLFMFSMMFGVMYHLWRDVCGGDTVPGIAEPLAA